MINFLKYFFQSLIIYFFFIFGKLLGLTLSQKLFSKIFQIIGPKFKSKSVIEKNLELYNPKISPSEKENILLNMWSNYGKTFIEYVFLNKFKKEKNFVSFENEKILNDIFNKKEPVIFISGHFANFELMSMEITKKNIQLATIYRPLNNYFLNPFMEYLRKKYVCKNQIKKGRAGVREAMQYINNRHSIALMVDQRVSEGEIANLFNSPCLTTTLPAQLALKYKLKIINYFIKREKNNSFKIYCEAPIESNKFRDKIHLTSFLNYKLVVMIKIIPEQWIWTHNSWKL